MEAIKKVVGVFSLIKQEEKRVEQVENDLREIKTLDGESTWLLHRRGDKPDSTIDDCFDECRDRYRTER